HTWGDAKHTWDELHIETRPHVELAGEILDTPERTAPEAAKFSNDSDNEPESAPADDIVVTILNEIPAEPLPWENEPLAAATGTADPPHICIHCHRDPPDGLERVSAYARA